jgi:hypothetical protein
MDINIISHHQFFLCGKIFMRREKGSFIIRERSVITMKLL